MVALNFKRTALLFWLVAFMSVNEGFSQPLAFPGAEGFGRFVSGGRGGTIYHVTNLNDAGVGSFRDAVSKSNRIVVFDVGGYIQLVTAVSVASNITIAGQTAPGDGIGFRGGKISCGKSTNIIFRYLRIRPGSETSSTSDVAINLYDANNIMVDHCSISFAPWDNVDGVSDDWQNYPVTNITFQYCLISNPIFQQFGAHCESVSSDWTWIYNIFANSHNRNPLDKVNDVFVNNVLYNNSASYTTHTSTNFNHDIVNNYFIFGPASTGTDNTWYQVDKNQSIYYSGNLKDNNLNGVLDGSTTTPYWYQGPGTILTAPWSPITSALPLYNGQTAFRLTTSLSGTFPWDQMDSLAISQIKTLGKGTTGTGAGTTGPGGSLYTSQVQTGLSNNGYGVIRGGQKSTDTDNDGMPDFWEKASGSNPNVNDASQIGSDGYMLLEKYLNWMGDLHAVTNQNASIDIDLKKYTDGFASVAPVYALSAPVKGTVILLPDGHTARFTPSTFGIGSFTFTVKGTDNSLYSHAIGIAIVPIQGPTVSITSPANNATFTSPASITINATAADVSGTVTKVDFYNGATLLGTDASSPYSFTWANVASGTYILTAVATDNSGVSTTSAAISVTVNPPANQLPVVSITAPSNNSIFCQGAAITLTATANDPDGTIGKVEFFDGATLLSTVTVSPYTYNWTNAGSGTRNITAKATDNMNGSTTSTGVSITVNPITSAPTVTTPISYCQNATATALTATGTALKWYTVSTGGTSSATAPIPVTTATGTTNYYVSQTTNTCESARATIAVTVNAAPSAPTVTTPVSYCQNATAAALTATGTGLKWYTVSTGGTSSATAPTPVTTATGTTNYYVSQTTNTCESARAMIAVTINTAAMATISAGGVTAFCQGGSVTLSASAGSSYIWFNGANQVGTGSTYSATTSGNYTLQVINASNCQATSRATTVTVNSLPTATITAGGATTFNQGGSVLLSANTGAGLTYQWFNGVAQIGTGSAYTATAGGNYTVEVTNASSCKAISSAITITVNGNQSPVISITAPADNAVFTAPANIMITATATDPDGTVAKVDFYNGATLLGTDPTSTYNFAFNNLASGAYTITAIATDNNGATTTSSVISFTVTAPVNQLPTVSITVPVNGISYVETATVQITAIASDGDGTVSFVEFYNGSTLIGSDASSPYNFTWNNVMAGTYNITAKATDNSGGVSTSSVVMITVTANQPSVITIVSPINNSTTTGSSVNINVTATDPDGSITLVQYYDGTTLIGSSMTQPYSYTWIDPTPGTHEITVKVTDSNGGVTTSSPSTVTVGTSTGITSASYGAFTHVYPNPTLESFTVKTSQEIKNLSVVNMYGVEVFALQDLAADQQVEIGRDIAAGTYVLLIKYASDKMEVSKLVKIR